MSVDDHWWDDKTCPRCASGIDEEPPERCTEPRYRLLHWLAYLSEDRICAGWLIDCQACVTEWCAKPAPVGSDFDFCTVDEAEAAAVLGLIEEAGGQWLWDLDLHRPAWSGKVTP